MTIPASTYGFQLDADQFSGLADYGDQYGNTAYGGTGYTIFELPIVHGNSDDPSSTRRRFVGEVQHRRQGVLIGSRSWAQARRWAFEYIGISEALVESFRTFFDARRFRLVPNVADEATYYVVHWTQTEFNPRYRHGGVFDLSFSVEEVP